MDLKNNQATGGYIVQEGSLVVGAQKLGIETAKTAKEVANALTGVAQNADN